MPNVLPPFADPSPVEPFPETGLRGQYGEYLADPALVHAARTALGLDMPLLLTGEAGCGKSDFAWVAAHALGLSAPLRCHVRSDTRARDLLYHYDAVARFGEAQHGDPARARDPRLYIALRPLGAALMVRGPRQVVLIDEVDKAPRDLPNDLLHELDEGHFEIPEIGADLDPEGTRPVFDGAFKEVALRRHMVRPEGQKRPFVILTNNAERQLPEPFLRRCVFFHIPAPTTEHLANIARRRFPDGDPRLMGDLAAIFSALRGHRGLVKKPTTAEMLRWIEALARLYKPAEVGPHVARFTKALAEGQGRLHGVDLTWAELPGLCCLLKLHEDLETVGAA